MDPVRNIKQNFNKEPCLQRPTSNGVDLTSKNIIKKILKEHSARPVRYLGQNFLISKQALKKILSTANLQPDDIVLEIGPGIGTLTVELASRVKKVIAIEKDKKMVEILKEILKDFDNIKIIQEDILKSDIQNLISKRQYKLVANLPYYITSPVIRKFLEIKNPPALMVLMVQKEVAQRICAIPPKMSILAVSVQFYARPNIVSYVSKKSFWPQPKVDSAILKISAINRRRKSAFNQRFFKIVKAGFSHPRKQLINNLSKELVLNLGSGLALSPSNGLKLNKEKVKFWLLKNKINPSQRAETLRIEDWVRLTETFKVHL